MAISKRFKPRFVFQDELADYDLPDVSQVTNIMSLVDAASVLVDEHCGRTDGNGNGSLVYTTYAERLLLQARNRNIVRATFKPVVSITPSTVNELAASGNALIAQKKRNVYFTGVQANTIVRPDSTLSPLLGCSGRYGYPRRSEMSIYPDLNYGMNALQVASWFGGPPAFTTIDASAIDVDPQTGELWLPAGLYMTQYTEVVVIYNSGYDPREMPEAIKVATAALVRNGLARAGFTTNVRGISSPGAVSVTLTDSLIDDTIEKWLDKYKNIQAF